jgi:RimJ/RimL family protein N-acetyltransferase
MMRIGCVKSSCMTPQRRPSPWRQRAGWSAYQRRGLGSDAFRTLIAYLVDERGHHRLTVDPAADNLEAIRFYHKLGFERVGVMRCYERLPGGGWRDGLLMEFIVCDSEPQPNVPEREE